MTTLNIIIANYPYIIAFIVIFVGFYMIISEKNLIKKIIGLNLLQGGIIVFYVLMAKIKIGLPPVYNTAEVEIYSNPTPHVLMLTAIVVSVAVTSVACALIYIIYKNYGTIDEDKIIEINSKEQ